MIFAVIDTNVIVAAMMSKHSDSATVKVINAVREGRLKPVLAPDIIAEYGEVLSRSKFQFVEEDVRQTIDAIVANAVFLEPKSSGVAKRVRPFYISSTVYAGFVNTMGSDPMATINQFFLLRPLRSLRLNIRVE